VDVAQKGHPTSSTNKRSFRNKIEVNICKSTIPIKSNFKNEISKI
jgi:hypothetical protein